MPFRKPKTPCDNHPRFNGFYTRVDNQGRVVRMCETCRLNFALETKVLVCKHCDVIVKSEEDPRAKFESKPHKPGCPRYIAPREIPKFEDFGFYEDSRRERKHPHDS